jgi:hypothetical protein
MECLAYDQNGDVITYTWTVEQGGITRMNQVGNIIAWTAPRAEGVYLVTVEVYDSKGGDEQRATCSLEIRVRNNHSSVITELSANSEWVKPLDACHLYIGDEDPDV